MDSNVLKQLNSSDVLEKYKTAGKIAVEAMNKVIEYAKDGVSIITLCQIGDKYINNAVNNVYKKKSIDKGLSFPTNININNYAGYYSPLDDKLKIYNGDIINIDLGVHIDGYPAMLGYTVVIGDNINEKQKNILNALSKISKETNKLFISGKYNTDVVKQMEKIASEYKCNLLYTDNPLMHTPGITSHQISRYIIDGNNEDTDEDVHQIILHRHMEHYDYSMRKLEFDENEVYSVNIMVSSGTGKINPTDDRVTILKKTGKYYGLKRNSSKKTFSNFNSTKFPINIREFDSTATRLGVSECITGGLLEPYGVYAEKNNEYIGQLKYTIIVKNKKPILVTGKSLDSELNRFN